MEKVSCTLQLLIIVIFCGAHAWLLWLLFGNCRRRTHHSKHSHIQRLLLQDRVLVTFSVTEAGREMGNGDVLLVRGSGFRDRMIQGLARSWHTHVAIAIRNPPSAVLARYLQMNESQDGLYIFESVPPQPRMVSLANWWAIWSGSDTVITWRKLLTANDKHVSFWGSGDVCTALETASVVYPSVVQYLLGQKKKENRSYLNCAQTILALYKEVGIIKDTNNLALWTPSCFSSHFAHDHINQLLRGQRACLLCERCLRP